MKDNVRSLDGDFSEPGHHCMRLPDGDCQLETSSVFSDSSTESAATSSTTSSKHPPRDLSQDKLGKPAQPILEFPTKAVGSTKRLFHASWYEMYPWL